MERGARIMLKKNINQQKIIDLILDLNGLIEQSSSDDYLDWDYILDSYGFPKDTAQSGGFSRDYLYTYISDCEWGKISIGELDDILNQEKEAKENE